MTPKKDKSAPPLSISEILHSKTRFLIYSLLSVYKELSLSQLSKELKRNKSTISHHLKKMIASGLVSLSKEEQSRSNIKSKFYCLVDDADDLIGFMHPDDERMKLKQKLKNGTLSFEERCQLEAEKLRDHIGFTQTKIELYQKWEKYLLSLEKRILSSNPKVAETALTELQIFGKRWSSISFYSETLAKEFNTRFSKLYQEMEELIKQEVSETGKGASERPYVASMTLFPVKIVLDQMQKEEN
ncbi:ArsR family transcriptional regulator [Candidatus Lokiarchaeum ossiferum]|uniref:ArsR family transcriptional regulator n=1 Tax=Candidatus Lokiarchaeum ossiferum TaxID=2951803 RepID=UPI00352F0531